MKYKYVEGTIGIKIQTGAYNKIAQEAQKRGCTLYQAANYLLGIETPPPEKAENISEDKNEKKEKENEELKKKEKEKWSKRLQKLNE